MILLYIDPGTGSMLFAILIGILGAVRYLIKIGFVKLKFLLSGGKKVIMNTGKLPLVIFSDNKRYWNVFSPICDELNRRGIDVVYMTASSDDPALECGLEHVKGQFIGEGNKAFVTLNFLEANLVLSTTPGLDVYQWKRSKKVDYYAHIPHATGDITLYRMFGIDYYDGLLLSGGFQMQEVRHLEKLRGLPAKELYSVGIPYMDEMVTRLQNSDSATTHERTVLVAPSWGPSAIFSRFGGIILEKLLETGYHIIVRPHPQSFQSEKDLMDKLMKQYPKSEQLEWNRDRDNFEVLKKSDIMISDFSGVIFDFALVYDKPVLYADTDFDKAPYDAWWIEDPVWNLSVLPRIGMELKECDLDSIKEKIDCCISDSRFAEGREQARKETWEHYGEGAKRTVDWIETKLQELQMK